MRIKKNKSKTTKSDLKFKKGAKSQIIIDNVKDNDENKDNKP